MMRGAVARNGPAHSTQPKSENQEQKVNLSTSFRREKEASDLAEGLSCSPAIQIRQFTAAAVLHKFHPAFELRDGKCTRRAAQS
jgi:hypothetical protein